MKLVFIKAEDTNTNIEQALVLVEDDFDVDDLLDDERVTDVIDNPAIEAVITVNSPLLDSVASDIGENRPYFG